MAPRRRRAPGKMKKKKGARKGKMALNTKVQISATYRMTGDIVTLQGSSSQAGVSTNFFVSPQHSQYFNVGQSQEFAVYSKLYDEFQVNSVTVKYRPTVTDVPPNILTASTTPLSYTFIDHDGYTPLALATGIPGKILTYDSCKVGRIDKGWSRTMRVNKSWWQDTGFPVINPSAQNGAAQPYQNAGCVQVLGFYTERLPYPVGTNIGAVEITFKVRFRGKKPTTLSYHAPSGTVMITPVSSMGPFLEPANPPQSIETVLGGDGVHLSCVDGEVVLTDASGNTIVDDPTIY